MENLYKQHYGTKPMDVVKMDVFPIFQVCLCGFLSTRGREGKPCESENDLGSVTVMCNKHQFQCADASHCIPISWKYVANLQYFCISEYFSCVAMIYSISYALVTFWDVKSYFSLQ